MAQTTQILKYSTDGNETPDGSKKSFITGKEQFYPSNTLYMDCGSGAGAFSLLCASQMKGVKVLAYEGYHVNFSYLIRNIRENSLFSVMADDHHILGENGRTAVSIFEGVVNLLGIGEKRVVETRKVDSITAPTPGLMKITVPGAALEILKGAYNTITVATPFIVVEVVSSKEEREILAFLGPFGYREGEKVPFRNIGKTKTRLLFLGNA